MLVEAPAAAALAGAQAPPAIVAGRSAEGGRIVARRQGPADAPVVVLAVGSIHGDEPGGHAVIAALRQVAPARGVALWTVRTANPDGVARRTRGNARGVDLNRNFPHRWAPGRAGGRYWPGPAAASERETRALVRLVQRLDPDLTVHYHQPYGHVVRSPGTDAALLRAYARASGLPLRPLPAYRGTVAGWQNARRPGSALVVELPAGTISPVAARRHVRALLATARLAARAERP